MAFFSSVATIALAVSVFSLLLGPVAHFGVRCVVFLPDMHVLIVTYHSPTPEAADAGPLSSPGRNICCGVFGLLNMCNGCVG